MGASGLVEDFRELGGKSLNGSLLRYCLGESGLTGLLPVVSLCFLVGLRMRWRAALEVLIEINIGR